jgi:CheY-like chemotaxis protein
MPTHASPLILVVDDDETFAANLQEYLAYVGYQVEIAPGGIDGVSAVTDRKPGMLVVAYRMLGMTGLEFIAVLADKLPKGFPSICYGASSNDDVPVAGLTILPVGTGLLASILEVVQNTFASADNSGALKNISESDDCDELWKKIGRRKISELKDILGQFQITPVADKCFRLSYSGVQALLWTGKDNGIGIIKVDMPKK